MPLLARALLRVWHSPEFALAYARVGLREAVASDCPYRIAEWRRTLVWLQWLAGLEFTDWRLPTIKELLESFEEL